MLETLIEILGLPPTKVSPTIKVPYHTHISSYQHRAVSILLDHKIFMGDFKFLKNASCCFIQTISLLSFENQLFNEKFRNFDDEVICIQVHRFVEEILQIGK